MKKIVLVVFCLFTISIFSQETEIVKDSSLTNKILIKKKADTKLKNWQLFKNIEYQSYPDSIAFRREFNQGKESLSLEKNGNYTSILNGQFSSGFWLQNNKLLVYKQKVPQAVDVYYEVIEESDEVLKIKKGNNLLIYISESNLNFIVKPKSSDKIIKSQGVTFTSVWKGVLGMVFLLFIAFLFSSNKKGIDWKTVGLGLIFQLVIAIGVLEIPFVQNIFESIGQIFVNILDFTRAGSEFLFSGVMDINSYGFIFAFQVLPTIIFFSALTSLLFCFPG